MDQEGDLSFHAGRVGQLVDSLRIRSGDASPVPAEIAPAEPEVTIPDSAQRVRETAAGGSLQLKHVDEIVRGRFASRAYLG